LKLTDARLERNTIINLRDRQSWREGRGGRGVKATVGGTRSSKKEEKKENWQYWKGNRSTGGGQIELIPSVRSKRIRGKNKNG